MNKLSKIAIVCLAVLGLGAAGCKKKEADATATPPAPTEPAANPGTAAPTPPPEPVKPPEPAAEADFLKVVADHVEAGKGTVDVTFDAPKVVKAAFDPANLEGATAELEVDVNTLKSGVDKRDAHLKNPDYLNIAKFPKATVKVANVKKAGDQTYTADAKISIHGVEKTWPLSFTVVGSTADSVRVRFEQKFSRLDFGIGKAEGDGAKPELVMTGLVTIKKT